MKRFGTIILLFAVMAGVLAPIGNDSKAFAQGAPDSFIPPASATSPGNNPGATTSTSTSTTPKNSDQAIRDNIHCGVIGKGTVVGCFEDLVFLVPYSIGGQLLKFSAQFLDVTAAYTLSSKLLANNSFISNGWHITRDLSNIFFIIILMYMALMLVLGLGSGHSNPKHMLVPVILVALFINFSFLATEIVIDVSNTLALVFYNQISVKQKDGTPTPTDPTAAITQASTGIAQKPISVALAEAFQPQQFGDESFINGFKPAGKSDQDLPAGTMIMILIAAGIIYLSAAYCFFIAGLSFMGRIVQLMVLIIFSPFAFITSLVPTMRSMKGFGFDDWLKTLVSTAFAAPIYFFFLLLISMMTQSPLVSTAVLESKDSTVALISLAISFIILYVLLKRATEYVKKAGGELGDIMVKYGSMALGAAGGYALGVGKNVAGAAIGTGAGVIARIGQKTIGAGANKMANSEKLKDRAATSWVARQQLNLAQKTASASFDARNTKAANTFTKKTGVGLNKFSLIKTEQTAGGYKEKATREAIEERKVRDKLGYNKKVDTDLKADQEQNTKDRKLVTDQLPAAKTAAANAEHDVTEKETTLSENNTKVVNAENDAKAAEVTRVAAEKAASAAYTPSEKAATAAALTTSQNAETAAKKVLDDAKIKAAAAKTDLDTAVSVSDTAKANLSSLQGQDKQLEDNGKNIDQWIKDNQNARFRSYLHSQGQWTGFKTGADGKVDTSTPQANVRSMANALRRVAGTTATGALTGAVAGSFIPGAGTALGTLAGAVSGLALGVKREIKNKGATKGFAETINIAGGDKSDKELKGELKGKSTYKDKTEQKAADLDHALHVIQEATGKKPAAHGADAHGADAHGAPAAHGAAHAGGDHKPEAHGGGGGHPPAH